MLRIRTYKRTSCILYFLGVINSYFIILPYSTTYSFAPEKFESGVAVAEVVGSSQHPAPLHGQLLSGEDLQQGQEPRPVLQVVHQARYFHGGNSLERKKKGGCRMDIKREK